MSELGDRRGKVPIASGAGFIKAPIAVFAGRWHQDLYQGFCLRGETIGTHPLKDLLSRLDSGRTDLAIIDCGPESGADSACSKTRQMLRAGLSQMFLFSPDALKTQKIKQERQ